jgi:hypothetical protein
MYLYSDLLKLCLYTLLESAMVLSSMPCHASYARKKGNVIMWLWCMNLRPDTPRLGMFLCDVRKTGGVGKERNP